jgi:hypothetical protein
VLFRSDEKNICNFLKVMAKNDSRIKKSFENKILGGYISIENTNDDEENEDIEFKYNMIYNSMGILQNGEEIWMRRFSNYINMAEVPKEKYMEPCWFLDDASLSRFSEIDVTDTEQEDVEALTAKFIACFTPTSLSAQLRYAFHQRKQQKNESLDAFAQALREAAKKAYQQTDPLVLGQLVRDQFINGVNDTYVVEQLQITSPETVDDALRMANIIQLAKQSVTMPNRINKVDVEDALDAAMANVDARLTKMQKTVDELVISQGNLMRMVDSRGGNDFNNNRGPQNNRQRPIECYQCKKLRSSNQCHWLNQCQQSTNTGL